MNVKILSNVHYPVILLSLDLVDLFVHTLRACKFPCSQIAVNDCAGYSPLPTGIVFHASNKKMLL